MECKILKQSGMLCVIVFVIQLIVGCGSSNPVALPGYSDEQKMIASKHVLMHEIKLQEIVTLCATVNQEATDYAKTIQTDWWQAYWPLIDAADRFYLSEIRKAQAQHGEIDGQLEVLKFKLEAMEIDNKKIADSLERLNFSMHHQVCKRYLSPYKTDERRRAIVENHLPVLQSMLTPAISLASAAHSQPHIVLDLPTELSAERQHGRSFYPVEKRMKQASTCRNPLLLGLLDQWPIETFGFYCDGEKPILIQCTWGECDF